MEGLLMLAATILPALSGLLIGLVRDVKHTRKERCAFIGAILLLQCVLVTLIAFDGERTVRLFSLGQTLPIVLRSDGVSRVFTLIMTVMWTVSGFFSFAYMDHERDEPRYYAFYLLTLSALNALCYAATLVTMYLFFEMTTLFSLALVLHERSKEAVAAGIKYLIYSVAGATMGLLGIFYLVPNIGSATFVPGGSLLLESLTVPRETLLGIVFVTIVGFGTKAGMFPMHGWLPTAHPVAPAPASAVLSGVITKAGVLCIFRFLYYTVGADFIRGTWVQSALLAFATLTVFMGSMLALKEKLLKKRLAYSSVSQVSYVLCGLFLLDTVSMTGALLHVIFHAIIKNGLFLCAGAVIYKTGVTAVNDLRNMGRRMPIVMWCFTICSLGLIGIPPTGGFISKWYIAEGAIQPPATLPVQVFTWLVPVVLLISALLTAGYLLPISINAFFSLPEGQAVGAPIERSEPVRLMTIPLILLAAGVVVLGIFPGGIIRAFTDLAQSLM